MSDDEFDNIPDDFADVQDVDWAQILGPTPSTSATQATSTAPTNTGQSVPVQTSSISLDPTPASNDSSSYFSDDDAGMDSGFLAELDRLEETLTHGQPVAPATIHGASTAQATGNATSSSSDRRAEIVAPRPQSHQPSEPQNLRRSSNAGPSDQKINENVNPDVKHNSSVPSKRARSEDSVESISPRRKGKMKADDTARHILDCYEDELTCPICTDLFVAAHVGNPCGHSVCGDCGWQWYFNKAASRCCPCCRAALDPTLPMIPNISMNSTVEKHVKALALSGRQGWEPGGNRHKDWMARKQAWRDGEKQRERMKKMQQTAKPRFSLGTVEIMDVPDNWLYVHDEAEDDPTYEDSDIELIPRPIQRPRRRRQRGSG